MELKPGILSDIDILAAIRNRELVIEPFSRDCLGSWTYDCHLGTEFLIPRYDKITSIDPHKNKPEEYMEKITLKEGDEFILHPHRFVLATTTEFFEFGQQVVGISEGRSSLARLGVMPHVQVGIGEPGWKGRYTLELVNLNEVPVILRPNDLIAQIYFFRLISPSSNPYDKKHSAKYQNQQTVIGSRYFLEERK